MERLRYRFKHRIQLIHIDGLSESFKAEFAKLEQQFTVETGKLKEISQRFQKELEEGKLLSGGPYKITDFFLNKSPFMEYIS